MAAVRPDTGLFTGGNMAWWSWCILGVVLLGIELLAVDAQFYLVFAGLAADRRWPARPRRVIDLPVVGAMDLVRGARRGGDVHGAQADLRHSS